MSITPAQILALLEIVKGIITPEVFKGILKYFDEYNDMPSEEKILEMHGDIHPPEWYDKMAYTISPDSFSSSKNMPLLLTPIITYKVVDDMLTVDRKKLKAAAKLSCNFWNRFITPSSSIVVRLGTFYSDGYVIARAYKPYTMFGVRYGVVQFNTKYLSQFTPYQIAGTVIHEIGHTLGIGWAEWNHLYNRDTGEMECFTDTWVETDYGIGTQFSHWDEERHGAELMTGLQDDAEYLMSQTIDVMKYLGHRVNERVYCNTDLLELLKEVEEVQFTRAGDIENIDLEHFEVTELMEERFKRGGE